MKVGFLTSDLGHGNGWAHYSLSLIQAMQGLGIQPVIVCSRNSPDIPGLELNKWLPTVNPPDRNSFWQMISNLRRVRATMNDCDVVHATLAPFAIVSNWVAGNRPGFVSVHGSYVHLPKIRPFPIAQLYARAFANVHLICSSHYTQSVAQQLVPNVNSVVVNLGVDEKHFASPPSMTKKQGHTILTIGGVKARKGTLPLVRAVAKVRQYIEDVQCIVIGTLEAEPTYTQHVRAEIEKLQLQDCVHLLGYVSDEMMRSWYHTADVFVLPSINSGWKFEGFGLVHLEASAAGLPVIGTSGCGVEDAIDDGVTGLLISQSELEERLPTMMMNILNNPQLAQQMGEAGKAKARQQTWEWVARQTLEYYEDALR